MLNCDETSSRQVPQNSDSLHSAGTGGSPTSAAPLDTNKVSLASDLAGCSRAMPVPDSAHPVQESSFKDTARTLFDSCRDLTGATAGYVALSSDNWAEVQVLFLELGETDRQPCTPDAAGLMPAQGLGRTVLETGAVAYENDFLARRPTNHLPSGHIGIDNVLFAPLVSSGQVVGLLGLANKPGGFTESDARLTGTFGELLAIALHNTRLRKSLEASEARFRSVVETANAAIVTTDREGRITTWNRMAEVIFGYKAEEMLGGPLTRLVPQRFQVAHDAGMKRAISTATTRLTGETVETIGARKSGEEFPLEMSLAQGQNGDEILFTVLMHDITARNQLEEAMREARQSIETLIQASPLAITAVDLDQNARLWNPAAERIFGWSEGEVLGQRCPLLGEADGGELLDLLAETVAGQAVLAKEMVRQRKDGSPVDVSIWSAPLYDAQRTVRDVMLVLADVTERRRAEEALRRYAREQTALFKVASAMTSTLDRDRLVAIVLDAVLPAVAADSGWIQLNNFLPGQPSQAAMQYCKSAGDQVAGRIVPVHDCPFYGGSLRDPSASLEPCDVRDCSMPPAQDPDGEELHSSVCIPLTVGESLLGILRIGWREPYAAVEQGLGLLLAIGRQVSVALHNAQLYQAARQMDRLHALSELDQALAATLELRPLAEVTVHHVTAHLGAAPACLLLLSPRHDDPPVTQIYSPARGWEELAAADQDTARWQEVIDQARAQAQAMPFVEGSLPWEQACGLAQAPQAGNLLVPIWGEETLLALLALGGRPTGRPFTEEDRALARVAADHAGQAMQNAQLYHEVRQLLHERETTRAHLLQVEKLGALGRLAAAIAHEISNPLQAVEACLTLLHEEMAVSNRREKVDHYLEIIKEEVGRMSAIVRRMRDYYRPAQERLQPTDVLALLDHVLAMSGKELQHHLIRVERAGSHELPLIQGNPDHLRQVFMNLVLNAIDAMPDGGTLSITTGLDQMPTTGGGPPQAAVRVEVGDTGIGIPPEIQVRLFEPFFTTKEQAAGLGLSISHSIVTAHNGQIAATSHMGSGSTFSVLLPIAAA